MNMPTPRNYPLSAGDEVLIDVWGRFGVKPEADFITRRNDHHPQCRASRFKRADNRRSRKPDQAGVGKNHVEPGRRKRPNTFVSVGLGKIRSIKVNIVGEAVAPGTYTLSSLASLFNALYAAGGVNDIGSLRNIRVYRNNKEIANLDVYDYLLNGKI